MWIVAVILLLIAVVGTNEHDILFRAKVFVYSELRSVWDSVDLFPSNSIQFKQCDSVDLFPSNSIQFQLFVVRRSVFVILCKVAAVGTYLQVILLFLVARSKLRLNLILPLRKCLEEVVFLR